MYDDIINFNKYNTNVYTIVVKCFASTFFCKMLALQFQQTPSYMYNLLRTQYSYKHV